MTATTKNPPKHLVREYLARRSRDPSPPPTPEEIRRQLGWGSLSPGTRDAREESLAGAAFG